MEIDTLSGLKFGIGECGPQQDGCPSDGMSSDATVLCIDSDAEDEIQSQDGFNPGLESRLQEKGLQGGPEPIARFHPPGGAQEGANDIGSAAIAKFFANSPSVGTLKGSASIEANGKVSWGREQELADLAAAMVAAQRAGPGKKEAYDAASAGTFFSPDDRWKEGIAKPAQRKRKGNKSKKNTNAWRAAEDRSKQDKSQDNQKALLPTAQGETNQTPTQQKGRRRGRRGGRGRKQAEAEVAEEVPKLEQNLEEELAEQLANQVSNDSALSMGFSSIRLHVPGGNTMIILNDHELKDGTTPDDILSKIENSQIAPEELGQRGNRISGAKRAGAALDDQGPFGDSATAGGPGHQKTPSKGCGAFFPAALLKQMLDEPPPTASKPQRRPTHRRTHTDSASNSFAKQQLNVGASPFVPFSSFSVSDYRSTSAQTSGAVDKQFGEVQVNPTEQTGLVVRARSGTGCFIPMYSRDAIVKNEGGSKVVLGHPTRASLAESLSSIDDVSFSLRRNRLKFQPADTEKLLERSDEKTAVDDSDSEPEDLYVSGADTQKIRSPVVNNVGGIQGDCARVVVGEISPAGEPDNPQDELMQLLEGDNFTSFTSPLHLEDTLDGLEEEREARANAEGRLVQLEMENQELREGMRTISFLQGEVTKAQGIANTVQVMLFMALAKPDRIHLGTVPRGMFSQSPVLDANELAAVRSKLATKSAELMAMQKELEKKDHELKELSECWLSGTSIRKTTTSVTPKPAVSKKTNPKPLSSDVAAPKTPARRARSLSSSNLKLAPSKPAHSRTMSASMPVVSKVAVPKGMSGDLGRKVTSVRSRVTEVTKTTTTTMKMTAMTEETTEETTTTKERKSVKKVTVPLPSVADKKREAGKRLWR